MLRNLLPSILISIISSMLFTYTICLCIQLKIVSLDIGLAFLGVTIGIITNLICTYISIKWSSIGFHSSYSAVIPGRRGEVLKYLLKHPKSSVHSIATNIGWDESEIADYLVQLEVRHLVTAEKRKEITNKKMVKERVYSLTTPPFLIIVPP